MKTLISAAIIGGVGSVTMTYLFNNSEKIFPNRFFSNNELAIGAGAAAGAAYLLLNAMEIA